jgi:hypothetical protein
MTAADGNLTPEQTAARDAVIEADYRAGLKPLRQIGKEHNLSHTGVDKMAKARGWVRDLTAKIRAKADAKVAKAAVSKEVNKTGRLATEAVVVEANATAQYEVRIRQRGSIDRLAKLVDSLTGELEVQCANPEQLAQQLVDLAHPIGEGEVENDRRQAARKLLERHLGTAARVGTVKQLSETLEKLVRMERQAWGIADDDPGDNPAHAAGAATTGRSLSDAERAVRLARLLATGIALPVEVPA